MIRAEANKSETPTPPLPRLSNFGQPAKNDPPLAGRC
jgi:hypothetical protein